MNPDVSQLAQVLTVIGAFTAGMIGLAWVAKLAFRTPRPKPRDQGPIVDEARFSRLEDAVETIAVEVERIAEAQRFSAKLLAERARELPVEQQSLQQAPRYARHDTPSRS